MIGIGVFVVMVFVVAGLAGGIGYMVGLGRAAVAEEGARREREAAEQMRRERDAVSEGAQAERDSAVAQARTERDAAVEQARQDRDAAVGRAETLQEQVRAEAAARARAEAELVAAQDRFAEQIALLHNEKDSIQQMAAQVLEQSGARLVKQFTELADQRAQATGQELEQRRVAVDELIKPLSTQVQNLTEYVRCVEKDRAGSFASLSEQLQHMRTTSEQLRLSNEQVHKETGRLVTALRQPSTKGKWGERQLRNVVEAAGMLNKVDFAEQQSLTNGDGEQLRPDMVVRIGGEMSIVVDAKSPFQAFLAAHEARDENERIAHMAEHVRYVRGHIDNLTKKEYWTLLERSPEFVVMFMPSDVFLYAAWEQDPTLWEYAASRNVILATPTSLLVLLRSVAAVLRHETAVANIKDAIGTCKEMTKRLRGAAEHLNKLGKKLTLTVSEFNDTVGSMERRVLTQARRVDELQGTDRPIPELITVDAAVRTLALPTAELDAPA
ncbi:DNA recombination protein RmuC [Nocardia kruczakiae]|uniref:DNA recombination protein RmuC n=1 Tax=Nocardia kruczakiae TaxID=261477 RepID=A0ABU1XQQ2_9NOCA|nr:DNA recombination protein RmuC [Nocardia kruczakiae]MDR7172897.1 DNA recombination protein RmuC [Nocardia kruczakiae]